jgi:hypothetical protein
VVTRWLIGRSSHAENNSEILLNILPAHLSNTSEGFGSVSEKVKLPKEDLK